MRIRIDIRVGVKLLNLRLFIIHPICLCGSAATSDTLQLNVRSIYGWGVSLSLIVVLSQLPPCKGDDLLGRGWVVEVDLFHFVRRIVNLRQPTLSCRKLDGRILIVPDCHVDRTNNYADAGDSY